MRDPPPRTTNRTESTSIEGENQRHGRGSYQCQCTAWTGLGRQGKPGNQGCWVPTSPSRSPCHATAARGSASSRRLSLRLVPRGRTVCHEASWQMFPFTGLQACLRVRLRDARAGGVSAEHGAVESQRRVCRVVVAEPSSRIHPWPASFSIFRTRSPCAMRWTLG